MGRVKKRAQHIEGCAHFEGSTYGSYRLHGRVVPDVKYRMVVVGL
jgi:hypothetical protein